MAHSSVEQASQDRSAVVAGAVPPTSEEPVLAPGASAEDAACGFSADDRVARQEITDALSCFLHVCSQVQGYADLQALSTAAWLLKELADPSEVASTPAASCEDNTRPPPLVNAEQAQQLREAAAAATTGLRDLLVGPWGDALASLLCSQWGLASLVAQAPALGDEHAAAQILYSAADTARIASETGSDAPAAPPPTALSAEHALLAARRWMVSHAVCTLFCGERKLAAAPLLAAPPDGYVCSPSELREGSAAPAISLEGVPCRVAFERGKERNVLLSVAASGVTLPSPSDAAASCFTANVLLVEAAKPRGGNSASASGVVHAVAPAAGAEVRAAARQPRIAMTPDAAAGRSPCSRTWTLLTASGSTCACAHQWERCCRALRCHLLLAGHRGRQGGRRRRRSARLAACRMATGRWHLRRRTSACRRWSACASKLSSCARCAAACWTGCDVPCAFVVAASLFVRGSSMPVQGEGSLSVRAPRIASAAAMDLADVPNDAMLREMQRRLDCMTRPEKRVILVGALLPLCSARGSCFAAATRERRSVLSLTPCATCAGPPGCGKGTQSPKIKACRPRTLNAVAIVRARVCEGRADAAAPHGRPQKEHCLCHLATGDMLREAVAAKTPLGVQARSRARPNGCGAMLVQRDRAWTRRAGLPVARTSQGLAHQWFASRRLSRRLRVRSVRARLRAFTARARGARSAPFDSLRAGVDVRSPV